MNTAIQFVKESYVELKRSTWLTQKEAIASTTAVVILVAIFSLYVAGIDMALSLILGSILGR